MTAKARVWHEQIELLGVTLDNVTQAEAVEWIFRRLAAGCGGWVLTPNVDILRKMVKDPAYRSLTSAATLRLADGMPLIWASRLQGTPLKGRVAGSDLIWSVSERAAREGRSLFFLGGNPGAAEQAAQRLQQMYPGLRVAGTACPPLGFEKDRGYMEELRARLVAAAPDVCLVALSTPKQDRIIREFLPILSRTWFMGIGISFSFVSGEVRRAPHWMRRSGLEWLHRLVQEPRRLARRYLVDGIPFGLHLLGSACLRRMRPGAGSPMSGKSASGMIAQVPEEPVLIRSGGRGTTAA